MTTSMTLNGELYVRVDLEVEKVFIDGLDFYYISEKNEDTRETETHDCIEMAIDEMFETYGCLFFDTDDHINMYVYKKDIPRWYEW